MCGFAGIYSFNNELNWEAGDLYHRFNKMTELLSHRGPDSFGSYKDNSIGLGHRRLSIIDTSSAANQPITIGSPGKTIVYNGEIYNYKELRNQLLAQGCIFKSHSDTEVILNCYIYWGLNGLKKLEGIFAFAIWDAYKRELLLMRDRIGIKPLYYGKSKYGIAFGSEIKSIISAGSVDTNYSDQSFSEYLWYGATYEDRTFFKGISELRPGHFMLLKGSEVRLEKWWELEEWLDNSKPSISEKEAKTMLQLTLDKAVKSQMVADVPVGIFLSGGIDSSALAASASFNNERVIDSYCAGFDFPQQVNEYEKADAVAKFLGLNHSSVFITGTNLEPTLKTLARAHDQPFGDAANIPLYLMSQKISSKHKVVLQGDGGDELFGGYRRYLGLRHKKLWSLLPKSLFESIKHIEPYGKRLNRFHGCLSNPVDSLCMALLSTTETLESPPEDLLLEEKRVHLLRNTDPFLCYKNAAYRFRNYDPLKKMFLTDLVTELPSIFLKKVDIAAMAASVEARVPLLDESIIKLAINIPNQLKVSGLEGKLILKRSLRGRIPKSILRMPKTGFGIPYSNWLKNTLYDFTRERLLDDSFLNYYSFNKYLVEECLLQHKNNLNDRGLLIWKLLQLNLSKEWIDQISLQWNASK